MSEDKKKHRMNVVSRGLLDDITKPASTGPRPGSKASLNGRDKTVPRHRGKPNNNGSMEFLSKEDIMRQEFDLELEECGSSGLEESSGEEDDGFTGRTSEMFGIAEPLSDRHKQVALLPEQYESDDELLGLEGDTDVEVDSEEEKAIIRDIRAEITNQVKAEMGEELAVYREAKQRLKTPQEGDVEEEAMDPELKEAIFKMRKLDRILAKKIRKEKEVKRDRILLEKRLHEELISIKREDGNLDSKEVAVNTEKFLALTLPPSHNAGVKVEEIGPSPPVTPVFPTQVLEESLARERLQRSQQSSAGEGGSTPKSGHSSEYTETSSMAGSADSRRREKRRKDFIKRNIQLAADAGNAIAMTDDEKKRVSDLLDDLEALPDIPEENASVATDVTENPYQIVLSAGEGFFPTGDEMKRLEHIDNQLKALLPPEDFRSIASTPRNFTPQQTVLFTRTTLYNEHEVDELGETALKETKEQRDFKQRLHDIELELETLSSAVEMEIVSPTLSNTQLQDLLDECARTMSRATAETDSLSQSSSNVSVPSSRQRLLENPPKLPDDVLQKLLAEAREACGPVSSGRGSVDESGRGSLMSSVSEDTIRELLRDSRTTSRASNHHSHPDGIHLHARSASQIYGDDIGPPHSAPSNEGLASGVDNNNKQHFLPEIDPSGQLSTQRQGGYRLNNEDSRQSSRPNSGRVSANLVWNNITNVSQGDQSGDATPTPHPPSGSRGNSGGRNRTTLNRNSAE